MRTKFPENIKALRKEQHITQEQLAKAIDVTAGAIYKWEQELSTPDISIIMELSSFFGVSVDALVGYEMCSSDKERILQELKRIKIEKDYKKCWDEVEMWVHRYPNDFDVIYNSGILYYLAGIETRNSNYLSRSITLLNDTCNLIGQNKDHKISKTSIYRDIAFAYIVMGKGNEGVQQLKDHNPCGVNDDIIGQELATNRERREEALPYLSMSLLHSTASLYRIVMGFVSIFFAQKDYTAALNMLQWMNTYLDGLKTETGSSYLDKGNALCLALCGVAYEAIGHLEEAKVYLRKARQVALNFDISPDYTSQNIRYCKLREPQVAYDNIGITAMDAIVHVLKEVATSQDGCVLELWEDVCHEQ